MTIPKTGIPAKQLLYRTSYTEATQHARRACTLDRGRVGRRYEEGDEGGKQMDPLRGGGREKVKRVLAGAGEVVDAEKRAESLVEDRERVRKEMEEEVRYPDFLSRRYLYIICVIISFFKEF